MFNIKKTASELERLLSNTVNNSILIVPNGKDSFKYKNYVIERSDNDGWNVFIVTKSKILIASTYLKVAAFAICKCHDKKQRSTIERIKHNDAIFDRQYTEGMYFKHTLKVTTDAMTADNALWRLEIAQEKARQAKQYIDNIFYSSVS